MASSISTTASASASAPAKAFSPTLPHNSGQSMSIVHFPISSKKIRCLAKNSQRRYFSTVVKAQLNEVSVSGSSNTAATPSKSEVPAPEAKEVKPPMGSSSILTTEESISDFIAQVSSLVKLVDSKDIVEFQMKQLDCEVIIRKKEALPQPPSPPTVMMHAPPYSTTHPSAPAPSPISALPSPSPAPASPPSTPAPKAAKPSLPPLKCPMAGTFYRSPGPGEPPFVKVGDKVQKGQVVCIIEAMKLMNDIEADQSGTVIDILAEDGKPVSVDTPLLVIQP